MNKEKLNSYAASYKSDPSNDNFNRIYYELDAEWSPKYAKLATSLLSNEHDVQALYEDTLLRTLNNFKSGDFVNFLSMNLRNARADLYRKNKSRSKLNEIPLQYTNDEGESPIADIEDSQVNIEEEVIRSMCAKKEADKRQLISFLLRAAKPDTVTTAIVTDFHKHDSFRSLAKALGIDHKTVKRKLEKLSRHYDANRFGDIEFFLSA